MLRLIKKKKKTSGDYTQLHIAHGINRILPKSDPLKIVHFQQS